ncbi:ROK family protein [Desertivibrio insolitus]|uniref:ROK family protein n=1 Tax=Herbiconiux sp. SYSU D00978 TaxID=2812562 RepID=UPI0027DBB12A|nr:ROK family protein [Herbiconiux sp. SYSU D00978]
MKPLLDRGVLVELDELADGSIGRPSRPLDVSPTVGTFVGIKLTGDHLFAVVTDVRANPIRNLDVELSQTDPSAVTRRIADVIADLEPTNLRGVGISLGGLARKGDVLEAPFLGWRDVHLAQPLAERLAVPVVLENDLVALAEAERWFGLGRGLPGFAVITIGAGVGYALVINGEVVRSPDAGVGTGGHIPLDPLGPYCVEGHKGCSQAMLTIGAIAAQASAALQRTVSFDDALKLAEEGEPAARAIVEAAGDALGRLIALTANLTLQSSVVLAGDGIAVYRLVADRVAQRIASERSSRAQTVSIHVDSSGFRAWARGAAAVAIQDAVGRLTAEH